MEANYLPTYLTEAALFLLIPLTYFRTSRSGNVYWLDKAIYYASYLPVGFTSFALGFAAAWNPDHMTASSNRAGLIALIAGCGLHLTAVKTCAKYWSRKRDA